MSTERCVGERRLKTYGLAVNARHYFGFSDDVIGDAVVYASRNGRGNPEAAVEEFLAMEHCERKHRNGNGD